jgi:DNA-directed RNA polymerase subunit alpha
MRIRWRGLELPTRVEPDTSISTGTYGRFVVEPFERGFGTTVGNSLRRILLSSLEGAAAISIKIAGVDHEFAQIEGVMEDVTDIILNVKGLIISMEGDQPKVLRVTKKGPGPVTAGDLTGDASVTVHNKDKVIATVTGDITFDLELDVRKGRGFVTALENTPEEQIIGVIPIDSIYSPVTRVRYKTEDTRVGQKTNYDRLIIEIWTNGTITPELALVEAAKILRKHLNPFIQYSELGPELPIEDRPESVATTTVDAELERKLNMSLAELELSVRATNCLESEGITTVRDLVIRNDEELLEVRNFGETTLKEVKGKLAERGLQLGMKLSGGARR